MRIETVINRGRDEIRTRRMFSWACLQERRKAGCHGRNNMADHSVKSVSRFQLSSFLGLVPFLSPKGQGGMNKPRVQKEKNKQRRK